MQQQQPKQARKKMLSPSDRRMLQGISDNLSHLRRPQTALPTGNNVGVSRTGLTSNGIAGSNLMPKSRSDAAGTTENEPSLQNGVGQSAVTVERAPSGSRIDYKKAMEKIRQSLQEHHVQAQPPPNVSVLYGSGVPGLSPAGREAPARLDPLRQVPVMYSNRNDDKMWEVVEHLANQEVLSTPSGHLITGTKVTRRTSFEEKNRYMEQAFRTVSTSSNSRSNSPNVAFLDGQMSTTVTAADFSTVPSGTWLTVNPDLAFSTSQGASTGAVAATNRVTAGAAVTPVPARLRSVAVSNGRPTSGPSVLTPSTKSYPYPRNLVQQTGAGVMQVAAATPLPLPQPAYAVAPTERSGSSMNPRETSSLGTYVQTYTTAAASSTTTPTSSRIAPTAAAAWSARQPPIVMQHVVSCEVEWPSAQKATQPLRTNREGTPDLGGYTNLYGRTADYTGVPSSASPFLNEYSSMVPATVVSTLVTFGQPNDLTSRAVVNQSPLSHTSSGSSTPSTTNSGDISSLPPLDKPPPPYPGRSPITHPPALRPVPPLPTSNVAETHDGTEVDSIASDRQLIESPKPVRRADACRKDAERSETRVRHYAPQAFRFFMEQHVENILKMYVQRMRRRTQFEEELSQCLFPQATQTQLRRMMAQKESNYLRLRRARIDRSMFEHVAMLGTGAFGQVDLVRKRDSGVLFALKTLRKKDVLRRNQVAHVKAERDILAEADNEWVVKLYYSFQDAKSLYFVMDYIPGGDLMGLLIRFGVFEHDLAQFYIAELVLAIESVHAMGFIHRDIKPDNILIDKHGHIRLTDFGLCTGFRWTHNSKYYQNGGNHPRQDSMEPEGGWSEFDVTVDSGNSLGAQPSFSGQDLLRPLVRRRLRHQRNLAHSLVGTPNYIAPEVLAKSGYTNCCDWWSVGVILYEMRVGQPPFLAPSAAETQRKVINWQQMLHIPPEADLSPETTDLILQLCCSADSRLGRAPGGANDVKRHPFFTGIEFGTLRTQRAPFVPHLSDPTDTSNFDPGEPEDKPLRRSASLDSLLAAGGGGSTVQVGGGGPAANSSNAFCEGGRHAFLEFTFRRFFDDDGRAHPLPISDPDGDDGSPIFV